VANEVEWHSFRSIEKVALRYLTCGGLLHELLTATISDSDGRTLKSKDVGGSTVFSSGPAMRLPQSLLYHSPCLLGVFLSLGKFIPRLCPLLIFGVCSSFPPKTSAFVAPLFEKVCGGT